MAILILHQVEEYQTFINFKSYEYTKDKILFLCNITYRTFFVGKLYR